MSKKTRDDADPETKSLLALTNRAQKGDKTAMPELREFMARPESVELTGNLARMAQDKLVANHCGDNLLIKEGLTRKMESLRAELAGPNAPPLERLLVERIVACWLHVNQLESVYAGKGSMALDLATFYQRSITFAHRRYLSAIKTLATVRKLALPTVQVNIAKKQVNVAGPCVVAEGSKGNP